MVVVESTANGVSNEFHRLCLSAAGGRLGMGAAVLRVVGTPEYTRPLNDPGKFQASLSAEERG